jgi:MFS family permease
MVTAALPALPAAADEFSRALAGTGAAFLSFLAIHVLGGLTAVASGVVAATAPKQRGRHTRAGAVYYWAITAVFGTATAMTAMRPARDCYLALLGLLAFVLAAAGRHHRRHPASWPWRDHPASHAPHIVAMGGSYTVLLTAFYVDNGKNLPLWDRLPTAAYWLLPAIVATPIIGHSIRRHRRPPITPAPGQKPRQAGSERRGDS